ncbi:MAG: hypothetical protein DMF84_25150 [Acidobacteria bacterium]|nr:MAG: hypothetical protein DMF84_25150 [Acidobacteriota bacterium]
MASRTPERAFRRSLTKVEAGERVELTRRDKPIPVVVSLREFERLRGDRLRFGDAYNNSSTSIRWHRSGSTRTSPSTCGTGAPGLSSL